jgi:WD40 repeat protein
MDDDDLAATTGASTTTTTSPGTHPPAVPAYILRGHASPIHALDFFRHNAYLASGDSDGWIVVWSLASKRAVAVWKAHEGALLGVRDWDGQRLVTYEDFFRFSFHFCSNILCYDTLWPKKGCCAEDN